MLVACSHRSATLVILNTGQKAEKVTVDERPYTLPPGRHEVLRMTPGEHYVQQGHAQTQTITLAPERTMVFDPAGEGCFAVIDYTPQYTETGTVLVEERFKKQPLFSPQSALTVAFGEPLPKTVDLGSTVKRLMAIDCSMIEVDRAIIEAVAKLP